MNEEFNKINSFLFEKYDNNNDKIDILNLIMKYSTKNDDLYKLYEVFSKSLYHKYNLTKQEYFDKYIKPLISNIYYKKVISKNVRFIIDLLEEIDDK